MMTSGFDLSQEITAEIPKERITHDQSDVDPEKVRPMQMAGFLRKQVSGRLSALSEGEIAALTDAMRELGVGFQGGAEAVAIFHQALMNERQEAWIRR